MDEEKKQLTTEEKELAEEYYQRGVQVYNQEDYEEAVEWFDKCLNLDSESTYALLYKGLLSMGKEENFTIIDYFERFIKSYTRTPIYQILREKLLYTIYFELGLLYWEEEDIENAAINFIKSKSGLLQIIFERRSSEDCTSLVYYLLDSEIVDLFTKTISIDNKYRETYKNIYVKSLEIVASLYVNKDEERQVAHYTRKTVAEQLLAYNSPFRLNTVATANDPKEGKPLLKYLNLKEEDVSEDYQAFVGCFIFNSDSLNQFRLYGKEEGKEATGVSVVFDKEYFNKNVNINPSLSTLHNIVDKDKQALFRCIYLDPETEQVISVGHKEEYTFYREKYKEKNKIYKKTINEYNQYKRYIEKLTDEVRGSLNDLKDEIDELLGKIKSEKEKEEARKTICELLIHLRYLVKHVAFKEEQECRIIRVEPLTDNKEIHYQDNRMYIEYLPASEYITDVYFGPKATGIGLFKDLMKHKGLGHVRCHQCEHPFF